MAAVTDPEADRLLLELLLTPEGRRDPYPRYAAIRERARVLRTGFGPVVLSGFDDCQAALRHHALGKGSRSAGLFGEASELRQQMSEGQSITMLFANPPEHTRLRRLVSRAFTPGRVEALRPEVERMVDDCLDRLEAALDAHGEADVLALLGFPLPVTVIGELLGIPEADRPGFQPLVQRLVLSLELNATDDELRTSQEAAVETYGYFADQLARRRTHPTDDLLTAMALERDEHDHLTEDEIIATAILLFAAGFETTTNLIGNGLLALLEHPGEMARLRNDPTLAPTAVEELLRWDSPVQFDARSVLEDVVIAGEQLRAGDTVVTLLGSANRDPEHYEAPDRFDVGRSQGAPMSFGSGIHHCLGAALARMEGEVTFTRLLTRFPALELAVDHPTWRPGLTLRGLASLPVRRTNPG